MVATKKQTPTRKVRIVVVDDHPVVRRGMHDLLSSEPDLEVCGEASGIDDGLRRVRELNPDIVIVDLSLENGHGLELVQRIKDRHSHIKTLICSMHDESLYAERGLRAGASGYINKQEATEKIVGAIRDVMGGRIFLSSAMTEQVLQRAASPAESSPGPDAAQVLSPRELSVLELLGRGQTTREIAEHLHLSIKTVETYREKIKSKLMLANGTQLVRYAAHWALAADQARTASRGSAMETSAV
jgi:DNA-binding NarL/FixJ family response regulator